MHRLFLAAFLIVSCGKPADDVVQLEEVRANLAEWDGRIVTVEGWLLECEALDCHVVPSRDDLVLLTNACPGDKCDDALEAFEKRAVSVGSDEGFDQAAKALQGKHVLITATVNASAWRHRCLDRCDALQPVSIVPYPAKELD
jgi:hypothetical protein